MPCVTTRQLWRAVPYIYRPAAPLVDRSRVRVVEFEFVTQGRACQRMSSRSVKLEPIRAAQLATRRRSLPLPIRQTDLHRTARGGVFKSFLWNTSLHVDHSFGRVRVPQRL